MWLKKLSVFLCILCVMFLGWECTQMITTSLQFLDKNGKIQTLTISKKDKNRLYNLMSILFADDSFAYVILGSKPMSWSGYLKPFPFHGWQLFYDSLSKYNRNFREGWKTWLKYRHLFPSESIWSEISDDSPNHVSVLIVNNKRFKEVVSENQKDFEMIMHKEIIDGDIILQEAKHRPLISTILKHNQALFGILLGYGRDNSWNFFKACENHQKLGWVWEDGNYPKSIDMTVDAKPTYIETLLSLYSCPSFAGDPFSKESLDLKKEYLFTREKILNYYKGKDFLEATLTLIASFSDNK